ncbi:hypothetical protein M3Y98_01161200 [Aphelenchoides besseyi]|nr:hypothetical protein M3Y98_01161200 [Aphelenchoides besseyi]
MDIRTAATFLDDFREHRPDLLSSNRELIVNFYSNIEKAVDDLLRHSTDENDRRLQISYGVLRSVVKFLLWEVNDHTNKPTNLTSLYRKVANLLTQLTYRAVEPKRILAVDREFLQCVCQILERKELIRNYCGLIRNIAFGADGESGLSLSLLAEPLARASVRIQTSSSAVESQTSNESLFDEVKVLSAVYEALWNLANAHMNNRYEMCKAEGFLQHLIQSMSSENEPKVIEPALGLSKCLIEFIFEDAVMVENYVLSLINLVPTKAVNSIVLCRQLLQALYMCANQKKHAQKLSQAFTVSRFKFDLYQLSKHERMDDNMRHLICKLLNFISAYERQVSAGKENTPTYPTSTMQRSNIPMGTGMYTPDYAYNSGRPFNSLTPRNPINHDSVHHTYSESSKNSDGLKSSSGYSETTTSDARSHLPYQQHPFNFHHGYSTLPTQGHHDGEYAEPHKKAYIRTLNKPHSLTSSDTSDPVNLYENRMVIQKYRATSGDYDASTSSYLPSSSDPFSSEVPTSTDTMSYSSYNGVRESSILNESGSSSGSNNSTRANMRSPISDTTSLFTSCIIASKNSSPRSAEHSPIKEEDVTENDSASQCGYRPEKMS